MYLWRTFLIEIDAIPPDLNFSQIACLEHKTAGVHFTVHLVISCNQSNTLHLGAHFKCGRRSFDFQIFDQHHRVAIFQYVAIGIFNLRFCVVICVCGLLHRPLMAAIGADIVIAVWVSVLHTALRASWDSRQNFFRF